jgi:tyrosinase
MGQNLTERIAYLLGSYREFGPFSHNYFRTKGEGHVEDVGKDDGKDAEKDASKDAEKYGSIEDVHNSLHDYIGGGGQMAHPETSAFDPIFWLHHA